MKVLLSAFSCRPGGGSELLVGWRTLLSVAQRHDVWLLTNDHYLPQVASALARRPEVRVRLVAVGVGFDEDVINPRGQLAFHRRYDRWQRHAGRRAAALDRDVHFDLVHHATLAACWTRPGAALPGRPFVWGPVGGALAAPRSLLTGLGARGLLGDAGRMGIRSIATSLVARPRTPVAGTVVLVQNSAAAARLRGRGVVETVSNAWCVEPLDATLTRINSLRNRRIVTVGRLVPWKGASMAVRVLAELADREVELVLYGAGRDERRIRQLAVRLGVESRLVLAGAIPREALLTEIAMAGVLLHPALHEESGLAVAEALSLGTPVVCLDHGGPAVLTRSWLESPSATIVPAGVGGTVHRMARAVDAFLDAPPAIPAASHRPAVDYGACIERAYQVAVADRSGAVQ
jgi:glycosyltransferase involved in cell wall biosynthesis